MSCSCHGVHGVLHHSDLTCQSGEIQDTPAEHAAHHATPFRHAVLLEGPGEHDGASAEHAVHDAPHAGGPGAFQQEASHAADPTEAPGSVQQKVLLHLIGDQAAARGQVRHSKGGDGTQSKAHGMKLW